MLLIKRNISYNYSKRHFEDMNIIEIFFMKVVPTADIYYKAAMITGNYYSKGLYYQLGTAIYKILIYNYINYINYIIIYNSN